MLRQLLEYYPKGEKTRIHWRIERGVSIILLATRLCPKAFASMAGAVRLDRYSSRTPGFRGPNAGMRAVKTLALTGTRLGKVVSHRLARISPDVDPQYNNWKIPQGVWY